MSKIKLNQLYISTEGRVFNPGVYEDYELPSSLVDDGIAQIILSENDRLESIAKLKDELERLEAVKGEVEVVAVEPTPQKTVTIEVQKEPENVESQTTISPVEESTEGEATKPVRKKS